MSTQAIPTTESDEEKHARLQRERVQRAAEEGESYEISYHPGIGKWLVRNPISAKAYFVTDQSCQCGDWVYRGSVNKVACKHMISVSLHRLFHAQEGKR